MVKIRDYDFINDQVIVIYDKIFPLYIVKGEKNFLIDSGVTAKAEEFYSKIKRILEETDEGRSTEIQTLVLTHTHYDHIGAAAYLQNKYGFEVICSHRGIELLQKDKIVNLVNQLNQDYKKMVHSTSEATFEKLQNIKGVAKGDKIKVDGYMYFEVIETPGHTKCSASYLLHPWGILFPGDSTGIIVEDGSIKPIFLSSYTDYERSLVNMLSFDVKVLALPHNRFIKGKEKVKRHLENSLQRTREYRDEIMVRLEKEPEVTKIAEAFYEQEFPGLSLLGTRKALVTNLEAMIKTVRKECL